jgi:hypothetical protein
LLRFTTSPFAVTQIFLPPAASAGALTPTKDEITIAVESKTPKIVIPRRLIVTENV